MLDDRMRQRIAALNRGPVPNLLPQKPSRRLSRQTSHFDTVKPIPGLVRRGEIVSNEHGEHLVIRVPLDELWPRGERLVIKRHEHLVANTFQENDADLGALVAAFPGDVLLLDLETCGFAGSPLFLIGVLRKIGARLTVELLLARNYAEERAVLSTFWSIACRLRVLVTFNGKSFDWPMVMDRSTRHLLLRNLDLPELLHVDILHHSRRRWRGELPDCKLQTLERHICGRSRSGDIPGGQIPAAYQQFVQTGYQREMDAILLHNAIDLVTLLDLAMRLAGP